MSITREQAMDLVKKYNKEEFHIRHALTVGGTMKYIANEIGFADDADFWEVVGILHDVDFEEFTEEHCIKAPELLAEIGCPEDMVHAVVSHGYGLCANVKPEHLMEKYLFATDELTGLIGAYALMRPSKNCEGMEVKSLKKKFKDKKFAAGCERSVISDGAEMIGIELGELMELTIKAVQSCEEEIDQYIQNM
ncbi:MAG: hydrolase [Anaerovoracaceae bacterium]